LGDVVVDPTRFGIDVIFPAAMAGLAVGLLAGRRELVAALAGATIGVAASLAIGQTVGIIAGGILGPAVGLLVPTRDADEQAPLGSSVSAGRYGVPRTLRDERVDDDPDGGHS